jgi:hypothetical protein
LKLDFCVREAADLKALQDLSKGGGGKRISRIGEFSAFSDNAHGFFLLGCGD